jgi:dienelactone hydrolase
MMDLKNKLHKAKAVLILPLLLSASIQAQTIEGTELLQRADSIDVWLMDGAHRFVERKIEESLNFRDTLWSRDFSSPVAYRQSIQPNRERFKKIIGVVDERLPPYLEQFGSQESPAIVASTENYDILQVRWDVMQGIHAEGLWLRPSGKAIGSILVIPDADQTPEQVAGLISGVPTEHQRGRLLAEQGFSVLIPTLLDRGSEWTGRKEWRRDEQTHREWIYRQAFHMGRHIVGFEVQKILAAVDWFTQQNPGNINIGVTGYGEGGLLAFYSAAIDDRITATLVTGYFSSRQEVWSEPIYRNIWGLLYEFGDAEIASMIAPRALVIAHAEAPEVASNKGNIHTAPYSIVQKEFERIAQLVGPIKQSRQLFEKDDEKALSAFTKLLGASGQVNPVAGSIPDAREQFDLQSRQRRQVIELENFIQGMVRRSEHVRDQRFLHLLEPALADQTWSTERMHKRETSGNFFEGAKKQREYFYREVIGQFTDPLLPPNARTRKIYDTESFTGYDVVLDVWPETIAWGVILIPKNIESGEKRPVVVCQHGRQGLPSHTIEEGSSAYNAFAARLAERGFITFSPHNLYRGEDRYRWLDRKANTVKASMFSIIIAQHQQIINWLSTLPQVDPDRIGFYGLSYGGESAMRIPAIIEEYALSICSGDFNNWTRKVAATDQRFSFMNTIEWEMPYFDMGSTFDYAEIAYLIAPRPFMVERGRHDRVGRDRWVAFEYAKVQRLYDHLGISDLTEIEYFYGGHSIWGEKSFDFLQKHLWKTP